MTSVLCARTGRSVFTVGKQTVLMLKTPHWTSIYIHGIVCLKVMVQEAKLWPQTLTLQCEDRRLSSQLWHTQHAECSHSLGHRVNSAVHGRVRQLMSKCRWQGIEVGTSALVKAKGDMSILHLEALVTITACFLQVQEDGHIDKGMRIEVALSNLQTHTHTQRHSWSAWLCTVSTAPECSTACCMATSDGIASFV